ncbi:MAG: extracellular solute-binding protein [Anaerolineae bacterium]|jgi:multiple sugar transport system substrate-binding protein|nr:extracellular solute-binding protein [Anaerolineae bacterium]
MAEKLSFSIIGDITLELRQLLNEFEQIRHVEIDVIHMAWENAWAQLLTYALQGKGPDISHVGSTWVSSLVTMNSVREFSQREVDTLGGAQVFTAPAWQSATLQGDPRVWAIPWSSFTFLVHYRRDHLETAKIDAQEAFDTPEAILETIRKLRESGFHSPIVLPSGKPYLDRVHLASSWVWGAGGNFLNEDGRQVLLTSADTRQGLRSFFELYRLMSPDDFGLSYEETLDRFRKGEISVVLADCGFPAVLAQESPELVAITGVHPLPGVPFVSGDNLVIWQATRQYPAREHLALELVSFLVSRSAQSRFCQSMEQFPVRHDALDGLRCENEQLVPVLRETFETGRAHKSVQLWTRFEQQLGQAFDEITANVISENNLPVDSILEIHLSQLQHRFSLLIG